MVGWLNLVYVIFAAYAFALSDRRANSLPDHSSHHKSRVRVRLAANGDRGGKEVLFSFFFFGAHYRCVLHGRRHRDLEFYQEIKKK